MGRTGAHAYNQYGVEGSPPTGFAVFATQTRAFGHNSKISPARVNNNLIETPQPYSNEVDIYSWGNFEGSFVADFILSNPWFLELVFGQVASALDSGAKYAHTFTNTKVKKSFSTEVGFEGETANVVRKFLGCIVKSMSLRSALNQQVAISLDCEYAKEEAPTTTLDSSIAADDIRFPFTFKYGTIELPNATVKAEVQAIDLNINTEGQINRGHGSEFGVGAMWGKFGITGRIALSKKDAVMLNHALGRAEIATMTLKYTNGLAGDNEKSITFNGTGVGIGEHSAPYVSNEYVLEEVPFTVRQMSVVAKNTITSAP